MTMLDKAELVKRVHNGDTAKLIEEWLDCALSKFEKSCYAQFKNFDINCYQDVDKTRIVMLKLEMKVIDNLKTELFNAITTGNEAMKKIKENNRT